MDKWSNRWTPSGRGREEVAPRTAVMSSGPYQGAHGDPYGGMDPRRGHPPRGRPRWGRRIGAGLLVLVVLLAVGYIYLDVQLQRDDVLADYSGRPADTPGTNWLIVGSDSRKGLTKSDQRKLATGRAAGRRTDTMMLMHITESGGQTALLSLPRDSYVPIPRNGSNKLNAAFAIGGPKLLVQTVEKATGIRVDRYAEIGFSGFVGMVDAVGGVNLCIKRPMRDPKAGLNLKSGCQDLDGPQALGYVRTRASARADLDRVKRQRQFFSALVKKATGPSVLFNPFRSIPLASHSAATFSVDDDGHLHHLLGLAWAMRSVSSGGDGVTTTVPIGGSGSSPAAGSFIRWDATKAPKLFRAIRQDRPIPKDVIER